MISRATIEIALSILVRAVLGLIRGEDMTRWAGQLEAVLREMQRKVRQP